jgi:hypothetical protein
MNNGFSLIIICGRLKDRLIECIYNEILLMFKVIVIVYCQNI